MDGDGCDVCDGGRVMARTAIKVLRCGQSHHGGTHTWDLPVVDRRGPHPAAHVEGEGLGGWRYEGGQWIAPADGAS